MKSEIYLVPFFDLENAHISASNGQVSSRLVESDVADFERVGQGYCLQELELSQVPNAHFIIPRCRGKVITIF